MDGTWERILAAVLAAAEGADDIGWTVSVDSTVCRAHQHAAGARKKGLQAGPNPATMRLDAPAAAEHEGPPRQRQPCTPPLALCVTAGQAGDAPAFETVMAGIRVL